MAEPPTIQARGPSGPAETRPRDDATATVSEGPADIRRALIGRTLGQFTIVSLIGSGGGGDVYLADQRDLGRTTVVKVMRARARGSSKNTERFLRESRLASRLDHPYAAHIYAFGAEPDDLLWIAMEHVRGTTLSDLVDQRGTMPLAVFAPFFERLCEVVRSAHELGIVHRDIKPSNVMVIERAGQLLPKLLDFGIAKGQLDEDRGEDGGTSDPEITEQGTVVGTPTYMAPEQWSRPASVDHRTDVYALGGLAYRCVSGRPPFVAATRDALAEAHMTHQPPPIGVGSPALDEAIQRALAKPQDRRWQSATDFAAAVRTAIGGAVAESIPVLDARLGDFWTSAGPQPLAEALATLVEASTTVEADHAVGDVVDVACRWLAAISLAGAQTHLRDDGSIGDHAPEELERLREHARSVVGHADAATWLALAQTAARLAPTLTGLAEVFANIAPLEQLAERVGQPRRSRNPNQLLTDITLLGSALDVLLPLLEYRLVVGGERGPELWMGRRTTTRERVVVWGGEIAPAAVVLLDVAGKVALRLDPLVRARQPLPHGDVELFLIATAGRGFARLAATPWGFELEDPDAARLLDRLHGHDTSGGHGDRESSPYPGLAPFARGDADRFFGREREIDALANRLIRAPMVAVLGPSGVGKSSFLHAGLAPRLIDHHVIVMRPGRDPIAALSNAIDQFSDDTRRDIDAIVAALRRVGERASRGVVLIIDQFEELATLSDAENRKRFDRLLGVLASNGIRVVVGVRDDFSSILESSDGLRDRFEPFVLGAPSPAELQRVLVEPARHAGYRFEDGVVDDVVAEIAGRPAALPLLGFTAERLWQSRDRDRRTLTKSAYAALGGVGGAIATYADEVYESLGQREREIARAIFGRMVAPDGTRVPVSRDDLDGLGEGTCTVIDRLVDARLLAAQDARSTDTDLIEPIHECLAERWPRLVRWRSQDAADRALIADLRAAARRWETSQRNREQLWRGPLLADLQRLVDRSILLASEREFATASITNARRSARRRRALGLGAGTAITATAIVLFYLKVSADHAASSARRATSVAEQRLTESLVAHGSRELGEGHTMPALAYFAGALERGANTESLRLLIGIASLPWKHQHVGWIGPTSDFSYSIDRSWFAAGTASGEVRWWNSDATGAHVLKLASKIVWSTAAPDGTELAILEVGRVTIAEREAAAIKSSFVVPTDVERVRIGPGVNEVTLVAPTGFVIVDRKGGELRRFIVPTESARANAAGTTWAMRTKDSLSTIDVVTGSVRVRYVGRPRQLKPSGDRAWIAFLGSDRTIANVISIDGDTSFEVRHSTEVEDVTLSRDGKILAVIANDDLHLYDVGGGLRRVIKLGTLSRRSFAIDGDDVWIGGEDGTLRHWKGSRLVAAYTAHHASIDSISPLRDGLLTTAADGSIAVWDRDTSSIDIGPEVCPGPYVKRGSSSQYLVSHVRCDAVHGFIVGPKGLATPASLPLVYYATASSRHTVALGSDALVEVFERDGKSVAKRTLEPLGLAFADDDTLIVASEKGLHRWTYARDTFAPIIEAPTPGKISNIAWVSPAIIVGDDQGNLVRVVDGKVTARSALGQEVSYIVPSDDKRWLAVRLYDGTVLVLRGFDLSRESELPRGGDTDAPPAFDTTGEFVIRIHDAGVSLFERATGKKIAALHDLAGDLDDPVSDGSPDSIHVMVGGAPGRLHLPRDRRAVTEIMRDIKCRVPLRVDGVSLREAAPECR